jgi:hypothetical protein
MIKALAKAFNALHWAIGMTGLPANATPKQERSFVLMWIAIILGVILWCAILLYLVQ